MSLYNVILQHEDKIPLVENYEESILINVATCDIHGDSSGLLRW